MQFYNLVGERRRREFIGLVGGAVALRRRGPLSTARKASLTTARALGLSPATPLLARADKIVG